MAKTKFSIEGAFEQLEDIIEQLSSEEISLSDSMDSVSYTHLTLPTTSRV